MEEDMAFVEGTYRLPVGDWKVFIFSRHGASEPQVKSCEWDSGVTGLFLHYPKSERLDKSAVERVLSEALGVSEWVVVHGPDSMRLR